MDLIIILVFMQGFFLGWLVCKMVINYKVRKALSVIADANGMTLDEMTSVVIESEEVEVPNLFTEIVNNSIMLYNKDTNQFVSQASSIDELAKAVMDYNKIDVALVNHNDEKIWFVDGKVCKNLKEIE
jgi:hypothetical protein